MSYNAQRFHVEPAPDSFRLRQEQRAHVLKTEQVRTLRKLRQTLRNTGQPIL